jgi:hypothetical protein
MVKENIAFPKFARNLYISSLSSSVFCCFRGIISCGVASIFIEGDFSFSFSLFYLFYLHYNAFSVSVSVARSNINSLSFNIYSLF